MRDSRFSGLFCERGKESTFSVDSTGSVSVNTVAFEGDASYNEMLSYLKTSLTAQLQAHTGGSFKDYEFNISFERAGGEVGFTVPLHRMETEE